MIVGLELDWIRRKIDKDLVLPVIAYSDSTDYGGAYWSPEPCELLIGGVYYPCDHGIIEVSTLDPDNSGSVIAHEWRHHWQVYHGWTLRGPMWESVQSGRPYEDAIAHYFTHSAKEADALKFQLRYVPPTYGPKWEYWILRSLGKAL